jgi:hypothetical protein
MKMSLGFGISGTSFARESLVGTATLSHNMHLPHVCQPFSATTTILHWFHYNKDISVHHLVWFSISTVSNTHH